MKKYVSLLLVACMILAMLPVGVMPVFASEIAAPMPSVASGNNISTIQKYITLTFEEAINPATLGGITMKKASGQAIKGAYSVELDLSDATNKTVKVSFGRLENGESYKIDVTDAVKAADGTRAVTPITFTYTAVAPTADIDVTFDAAGKSSYSGLETYTSSTETGASKLVFNTNNNSGTDTGDVVIGTEEGSTDKYAELRLNAGTDSTERKITASIGTISGTSTTGTCASFSINDDLDVQVTEVASKLVVGGASQTSYPRLFRFNAFNYYPVNYLTGVLKSNYVQKDGASNNNVIFGTDSNKYHYAKTAVHRKGVPDGNTEYLIEDLYDGISNVYIGNYQETDKNVGFYYAKYGFLAFHASNTVEGTPDALRISSVKQYMEVLPSVLKADGYDVEDKKMVFYMSDDITDNQTALDTIKIVSCTDDEKEIIYTKEINNSKRTVTLNFPYGLPNDTYSIDLSGLQSANNGLNLCNAAQTFDQDGNVLTTAAVITEVVTNSVYIAPPVFAGDDGKTIVDVADEETEISLTDTTTVSARVNLSGVDSPVIILAVYKDNNGDCGDLVGIDVADISEGVYTAEVSGLAGGEKKHAKIFVWSNLDTIKPLYAPFQCL